MCYRRHKAALIAELNLIIQLTIPPTQTSVERIYMDINEIKQLAENGDINACITMGKYCYNQKQNAEGMKEALEWYLIAADQGSLEAIKMVILTKKIFAHADIQMAADISSNYENVGNEWDEVGDWAEKLMELADGKEELNQLYQFAFNEWLEAMYRLGVCAYFSGQKDAVLNMFKSQNATKFLVLKGVALDIQTEDDLVTVYEWLKSIETKEYFSMIEFKLEEQIAAFGALRISLYYRIIKNDNTAAVSFLSNIAESFSNAGCKDAILGELSLYKKKMFGGYSYQG